MRSPHVRLVRTTEAAAARGAEGLKRCAAGRGGERNEKEVPLRMRKRKERTASSPALACVVGIDTADEDACKDEAALTECIRSVQRAYLDAHALAA